MLRISLAFLVSLLLAAANAVAQDLAAEALEGAWVVSVGESTRDRFLIIDGARTEKGEVRVRNARYGWLDGKASPVTNWKAEIAGDTIRLSFVTPASSLITADVKTTDTSVSGDFTSKTGNKYFVRMTRLEAEEFAALREAALSKAAPRERLVVSKATPIALVYVGADDCPGCQRFIGHVGKDGKRLEDYAAGLAEARFVYVRQWSYRDPVAAADLPEDLRWMAQPGANGRPPLRKRGTPYFAAVVGQRVLAQGHGTSALQSLVAPVLRNALDQRRAAN